MFGSCLADVCANKVVVVPGEDIDIPLLDVELRRYIENWKELFTRNFHLYFEWFNNTITM